MKKPYVKPVITVVQPDGTSIPLEMADRQENNQKDRMAAFAEKLTSDKDKEE